MTAWDKKAPPGEREGTTCGFRETPGRKASERPALHKK